MAEERFEAWGICELMGHQRAAGRLSEQVLGGSSLLRVDVPLPEGGFRTTFYGSSALYAVHITDEQVARAAAAAHCQRPTYAYEIEQFLEKATRRIEGRQRSFDDEHDGGVEYG